MEEIKKQRKIGQIILVCKIIQMENEDLKKVPKINVSDIKAWLDTDEEYVATLLNICASFDVRNIADTVLNNAYMYRDMAERREYHRALLRGWKYYLNYLLEKESQKCMQEIFEKLVRESEEKEISVKILERLTKDFVNEYISRVHHLAISDMRVLDAILEIAGLPVTEEEYFKLRKMLLNIEEKEGCSEEG